MKRRLAWTGIWLAIGALLWLPLTSVALCLALRTLDRTTPWVLPIAAFYYWRDFGGAPAVAHWLPLCAVRRRHPGRGTGLVRPVLAREADACAWRARARRRPRRAGPCPTCMAAPTG